MLKSELNQVKVNIEGRANEQHLAIGDYLAVALHSVYRPDEQEVERQPDD